MARPPNFKTSLYETEPYRPTAVMAPTPVPALKSPPTYGFGSFKGQTVPMNKYGFADTAHTRAFGFSERGGPRGGLGNTAHGRALGGGRVPNSVVLQGLAKKLGSMEAARRYRQLWAQSSGEGAGDTKAGRQAAKEFPKHIKTPPKPGMRTGIPRGIRGANPLFLMGLDLPNMIHRANEEQEKFRMEKMFGPRNASNEYFYQGGI